MKKVKVEYKGGQSRYGNDAVDYMLAVVDDIELYAELPPVDGDETGTYDDLKAEIITQAKNHGIDVNRLEFLYD
jgi:hypothetical protein